jgi:hypothetical protein
MTSEEKLAYAIKNYPIGTIFISPYSNKEFVIKGRIALNGNGVSVQNLDGTSPWLLFENKWAEILSSPINVYELW